MSLQDIVLPSTVTYGEKADVPQGKLRERIIGDYSLIGSPKELLFPYRVVTDYDTIYIKRGTPEGG